MDPYPPLSSWHATHNSPFEIRAPFPERPCSCKPVPNAPNGKFPPGVKKKSEKSKTRERWPTHVITLTTVSLTGTQEVQATNTKSKISLHLTCHYGRPVVRTASRSRSPPTPTLTPHLIYPTLTMNPIPPAHPALAPAATPPVLSHDDRWSRLGPPLLLIRPTSFFGQDVRSIPHSAPAMHARVASPPLPASKHTPQ